MTTSEVGEARFISKGLLHPFMRIYNTKVRLDVTIFITTEICFYPPRASHQSELTYPQM